MYFLSFFVTFTLAVCVKRRGKGEENENSLDLQALKAFACTSEQVAASGKKGDQKQQGNGIEQIEPDCPEYVCQLNQADDW